ncbi:hypothetical protein ABIA35_004477 [Catenulispora sp. MAP12-49]
MFTGLIINALWNKLEDPVGGKPRGRLWRLASIGMAASLCLAVSSGTFAVAGTAAAPGAGGLVQTHDPKDPNKPSGPADTSKPGAKTTAPALSSMSSQTTPDPAKLAIADAIATAKKTHKSVPIPAATTAYATMVANPDGTVSANSHVNPQRAKVGGQWEPIDTTLAVGSDGQLHSKATVTAITLSDGGSAPLAVTDDGAGHVLTLTWPGTLPKPTVSGAVATYHAVYPGVDLQVTASATGITHLLVVHDAAAAANPALSSVQIGETGTGVQISATPAGGVQAVAADGTKVFTGQEPHMWDSAGKASPPSGSSKAAAPAIADSGPHTAALPAHVANGKITLQPDPNLLRGASTIYPVYIDPAWVENPQNWVEMDSANQKVWDGQAPYPWGTQSQPYDNSIVRVGNSGGTVFRSLLQFNADILAPNNYTNFLIVSDAWLYLTFQGSCVTTDVWATDRFDSGINWGNQDSGGATGYSVWSGGHVIGTNNCSANPWNPITINDASQVQQVFANHGHTFSVGLRAHNEAAGGGYGGIQVLNNGLIYDANITVKFVAEPWFENVGTTGVAAPVGNHGATQQICGNDMTTAGYLPMVSGPATFTAGLADWDAEKIDYHFWLNDFTSQSGTQDGGSGSVTAIPYSQSQTPGSPGTGGATTPLTGSFPTTTSTVTWFGGMTGTRQSVTGIRDGDLYQMFVQAQDDDPTVDTAFNNARGASGNNLEYPYIQCYFHAALSAPLQPDFPTNAGTTFVSSGTHLTGNYPVVGDGGNIIVHSSAPHTPIARFDWALNTSSTNAGAYNCGGVINAACGSVAANNALDSTSTITIGNGPNTQTLGTGEHWGNNYVYVSAVDVAGNVSAAARFDFFLGEPFQPVSFGNVTGDGTPNLMKADTSGNLDIYPANQDMDPNAADAVEVAPAAAAPNGTSWKNALYTHRGAERVQPTDDLFAWDIGSDNIGHLYYYFNAQTASASTQPGYVPPARLDTFTQTQRSLITRPTCTPSATNGWCVGYNQSNWNDVKKILAVGPVLGGCNIKAPTTACKTNLITIETDGHSPARMWMFSPAGIGQLRNPVLLSTSTPASAAGPGWDWATVRFLMAPGNAAGHPAPTGAPAAGGMPDLWAVDSTGTLYQFTNHSDTALAGAGLGDLNAKTQLGTTGQFNNYDWVSTAGDLNGDGNPDLWVVNGGRMDVLFGPIGANITDQNTKPMSGTGTKPTQAQSTATTADWTSNAATLQGDVVGGGLAGQVRLPGVVGSTAPGQKCLDDLNGSLADSTTVIDIYDCNGTMAQQWTFAPDGTIRYLGSDPTDPKCLDTNNGLIQGQLVTLFSCQPKRNQIWRTIPSPSTPGTYWIYNPTSGMCLDDSNGNSSNHNPFWLWPCIDSIAQRYQLPKAAGAMQQVEAESLWGSQSGATPTPQANCCGISLSNGYQSYFPATAAGASITYNWYVPVTGTYIVEPSLTKTNDRGQYTLTVDSTKLPTTFDGYQASGVSLATVPFGKISLSAGMHNFIFTAAGTNAASIGNRYVLGVDTLALAPTTTTGPTAALKVSSPGIVNQPVTADASASFPGTAGITGYTFDFGDGTVVGPQAGPTAQHAYTAAGTFQVKVSATDVNNASSTSSTTAVVILSGPPVINGDFESGSLAGWPASYNSGVTTTNPHSGTYAGQINAPTGGNGSIEQVVSGLTPNTGYTLTGWVRTDGGTTILGTKFYDADPNDDTGDTTTATTWTQLSSQFTTGPTNTTVDIYCYRPTAGTSACDDFTLLANPAAGAVGNPDFETGNLAGWNAANNAGITTTNPHSGTYAGQINAPTGGNGTIEQVVTGLIPNTSYTLAGWIRTDGGTTTLGAKQFDPAGDKQEATTTNTGWTQLTDQFTTGVNNTTVDIYCNRATAGTSACDDFTLTPTPATVPNHDFESGNLAGWTASYNAGVTTTNPHTGTYAGQINAPTGGNGSIEQVVTGLTPNTTYTLTGWVRTDGGATILGTKFFDADPDDDTGNSTTATGWTQLTSQFTTGPTNTTVDIYCYRSTAGTSACDDFTLTAN